MLVKRVAGSVGDICGLESHARSAGIPVEDLLADLL